MKKVPYKPGEIRKRAVKSLHVEVERSLSENITNDIRDILKRKNFKRYTLTDGIRLVSQYNWRDGDHDNNIIKIKTCIKIQGQFQAQLNSEGLLELEEIDAKIA